MCWSYGNFLEEKKGHISIIQCSEHRWNTEDALDQSDAALIATMWGLHLDASGRWGDNKRHRSTRSLTCMIFIMITWNVRCSIFCPGQGLRHFTSASEGTQGQPCHLPKLSYKPSLWPWMGTTAGYHVFGLGIKEIGERRHQCVIPCAQPCQHSQKRKQSLPRHTAEGNFLGKTQSLYENICLKRSRCTSLSMNKKHASFFLERGARV